MLTHDSRSILITMDFLSADWKRVNGFRKEKVVFAATSQCNRDISYCVIVGRHFEPRDFVRSSD